MNRTYTKKDFKLYKKSVLYWLNRFGITEWEIDFKHHQIDSVARTTYNCTSKLACFQLTKESQFDYCEQSNIGKLAFHEVIHLLLADFGNAIQETKIFDSDLAISQEHAVVMRMIKAFYE